jgi:hypothetical protein
MSKFLLMILLSVLLVERCRTIVGEKKRVPTSRSDGALSGHYLFLAQTAYASNTPGYLSVRTANELECKCFCSSNKQCLSITYRRSDSTCSLYANDPCDARQWQRNSDVQFYINVKRLKYRLFEKPEQNHPLKRLTLSSLCGSVNKSMPTDVGCTW